MRHLSVVLVLLLTAVAVQAQLKVRPEGRPSNPRVEQDLRKLSIAAMAISDTTQPLVQAGGEQARFSMPPVVLFYPRGNKFSGAPNCGSLFVLDDTLFRGRQVEVYESFVYLHNRGGEPIWWFRFVDVRSLQKGQTYDLPQRSFDGLGRGYWMHYVVIYGDDTAPSLAAATHVIEVNIPEGEDQARTPIPNPGGDASDTAVRYVTWDRGGFLKARGYFSPQQDIRQFLVLPELNFWGEILPQNVSRGTEDDMYLGLVNMPAAPPSGKYSVVLLTWRNSEKTYQASTQVDGLKVGGGRFVLLQ